MDRQNKFNYLIPLRSLKAPTVILPKTAKSILGTEIGISIIDDIVPPHSIFTTADNQFFIFQ